MTSSQDALGEAAAGAPPRACSAAEVGAIAHLYRAEIYRSTVWRTRLDSTTNWAVVTTGIALSATFSSAEASPLSMVLVGLIVTVFLLFEAAATGISTSGGHARGYSRPISTPPWPGA